MPLIIIGLVILAVIIFLLALPLEIELLALVKGRARLTTRLKLIFGLVTLNLGTAGEPDSEAIVQRSDTEGLSFISNLYKAVQTRGIWEQIRLLLGSLHGHVKIRQVDSDFKVSLGDDYYTGMLAGLVLPLALLVNQRFGSDIRIVPQFEEELILEGYLKGCIGIRPIEVIIPCLAFICSPSVRQVRRLLF